LENYDFLEEHGIENFVKYNMFHREQKKSFKSEIHRIENLFFNKESDYFVCPMGQHMHKVSTEITESKAGYKYVVDLYQAINCSRCPLNGACHKQKGNRKIEVNKRLIEHKQKVRENLLSEAGKLLRGRRCTEVEQTFGQIKSNKKFKRFLLRGIPKVKIEFGLISIAHNFQKLFQVIDFVSIFSGCLRFFDVYTYFNITSINLKFITQNIGEDNRLIFVNLKK
jgi:hypothetical protein